MNDLSLPNFLALRVLDHLRGTVEWTKSHQTALSRSLTVELKKARQELSATPVNLGLPLAGQGGKQSLVIPEAKESLGSSYQHTGYGPDLTPYVTATASAVYVGLKPTAMFGQKRLKLVNAALGYSFPGRKVSGVTGGKLASPSALGEGLAQAVQQAQTWARGHCRKLPEALRYEKIQRSNIDLSGLSKLSKVPAKGEAKAPPAKAAKKPGRRVGDRVDLCGEIGKDGPFKGRLPVGNVTGVVERLGLGLWVDQKTPMSLVKDVLAHLPPAAKKVRLLVSKDAPFEKLGELNVGLLRSSSIACKADEVRPILITVGTKEVTFQTPAGKVHRSPLGKLKDTVRQMKKVMTTETGSPSVRDAVLDAAAGVDYQAFIRAGLLIQGRLSHRCTSDSGCMFDMWRLYTGKPGSVRFGRCKK